MSQVAATLTGAGSWVTLPIPSPTPAGPSSRFMAGMHRAPMAGVNPTELDPLAPVSTVTFWATVILASSWLTRWEMGALEPTPPGNNGFPHNIDLAETTGHNLALK